MSFVRELSQSENCQQLDAKGSDQSLQVSRDWCVSWHFYFSSKFV